MRNLFFLLFLVIPFSVFSQYDEKEKEEEKTEKQTTKFTCDDLLKEHLASCERCATGDKCYTRRDIIDFCSGKKEQELIVVDPGSDNCGCPTYGFHYPQASPWFNEYYVPYNTGFYYTGPTFGCGSGLNLSVGIRGGYFVGGAYPNLGSYYGRSHYSSYGGHYGRGSYYGRSHYNSQGGYYGRGNYYGQGGFHGNGNYYNHGGGSGRGSYYGSRKTTQRGR